MGGLISRPVNYVKTKAHNTKVAIQTSIDNTKNSIWNFMYGIKREIVTKVTNTRDGIYNSVTAVKNGICNKITNAKNYIVGSVVGVKDGIVGGVTNVTDGVKNRITNTRNKVRDGFNKANNWSKKRKVFYTFFACLFFALSIPLLFISWDLYHGNYKEAHQKWEGIESFAGGTFSFFRNLSVKTFHFLEALLYYTTSFAKTFTKHALNVTEWLSENVFYGVIEGSKHLAHLMAVSAEYLYAGSCKGGEVLLSGSQYLGEKAFSGSQAFGKGIYSGAKAAGSWTYNATVVLSNWTAVTFAAAYDWIRVYGAVFFDWLIYIMGLCLHHSREIFFFLFAVFKTAFLNVYFVLAVLSDFIYRWSGISFPFILRWLYKLVIFMGEWVATTVPSVTKWIYVAVNRHALHWLWTCLHYLLDYICVAFIITGKFVKDLAIYVANFVSLFGQHIFNVLYVLYVFVYNVLSLLAGSFKSSLQGIVEVVKHVFGAIIWFLEETVFAYLYMLHQYNIYRELLFIGFIVLISMYCTGLVRDSKDDTDGNVSPRKKKRKSREPTPANNGETSGEQSTSSAPPPKYTRDSLMPDAEDSDFDDSDLDIDLPDSLPDAMDFDSDEELNVDEPDLISEEVNDEDLPTEEFPDFSDDDRETEDDGPGLFERIRNIKYRREEKQVENLSAQIPEEDNETGEIEEADLIPTVAVGEAQDDNGSEELDEFDIPVTENTMSELEPRSREISKSPADFALPEITSSDENRDSSNSPAEFQLPANAGKELDPELDDNNQNSDGNHGDNGNHSNSNHGTHS